MTNLVSGTIMLCGPISGIENYNQEAFALVASRLRACAFHVWNPLEAAAATQFEHTWSFYMEVSIGKILRYEFSCLVLLPGWKDSRGARIEEMIAREMGLVILEWHGEAKDMLNFSNREEKQGNHILSSTEVHK